PWELSAETSTYLVDERLEEVGYHDILCRYTTKYYENVPWAPAMLPSTNKKYDPHLMHFINSVRSLLRRVISASAMTASSKLLLLDMDVQVLLLVGQ
ncbi:hypothetical protein QC761_0101050, partial [Podospora bellae-mahoneyi]